MSDTQLLAVALAAGPILMVLADVLLKIWQVTRLRERIDVCFSDVDRRFDQMATLSRVELDRFGEVLDARLKRIEERG